MRVLLLFPLIVAACTAPAPPVDDIRARQEAACTAVIAEHVGRPPAEVTARLEAHPLVTISREEVAGLPPADWESVIIATGPLTSPSLSAAIGGLTGEGELPGVGGAGRPGAQSATPDRGVGQQPRRHGGEQHEHARESDAGHVRRPPVRVGPGGADAGTVRPTSVT